MSTLNNLCQLASALAFAGDISMGQPTEHSPRVTLIAVQFARSIKLDKKGSSAGQTGFIAMGRMHS